MTKKERSLSADDSSACATVVSDDDELSVDGSAIVEAGVRAGRRSGGAKSKSQSKTKSKAVLFVGLAATALVVGLSVGLVNNSKKKRGSAIAAATQHGQTSSSDDAQFEVFVTEHGFECTEHAACRCYDEEVCDQNRKGVFTTHTLEYDECETECLATEGCNG